MCTARVANKRGCVLLHFVVVYSVVTVVASKIPIVPSMQNSDINAKNAQKGKAKTKKTTEMFVSINLSLFIKTRSLVR